MPGFALYVLGLGVGVFGAARVDTATFGRAEVAAGSAPPGPNLEAEAAVTAELTPGVGARFRWLHTTLIVRAAPRFYYRIPAPGDLERPLMLARAGVNFEHEITPRWRWLSQAQVRYGEVNYTRSRQVLRAPITRQLAAPVISTWSIEGETGLAWLASERHEVSLTGFAGYFEPISAASQDEIETTAAFGGTFSQRYELDTRSSVSLPLTVRYFYLPSDPDATEGSLELGYRRRLDLRTTFDGALGASVARSERDQTTAILPRASASIERVIHETRNVRVMNRFEASIAASFDPTIGVLLPVAGLQASARSDLGPSWSVSGRLEGFTSALTEPLAVQPEATETTLAAEVAAVHALAPWLECDFGMRASLRGNHLRSPEVHFREREYWVFAGLSAAIGLTGDPDGHWAP